MKRSSYIAALVLVSLCSAARGQATLEMMRLKLRQFDYVRVVQLADSLLKEKEVLQHNELIEIYETRGIAQYSLQELDGALVSFTALLQTAPDHALDPARTSPKIIRFYDEIRQSLAQRQSAANQPLVRVDTLRIYPAADKKVPGALARSLLWPGWGHLHLQRRGSGIALSAANLALLGSAVWSAAECRDKEHAYLAATTESLIAERYKSYNRTYKTRNACLVGYTLFWLLSQADLLIFHPPAVEPTAGRIIPGVELTGQGIHYSCTIAF
jgi:hypothetical protein